MERKVCVIPDCRMRQVRLQDGAWANICPAGVIGGCEGPNASELEVLDATAGRMHGQSPQTPPLIFDENDRSVVRAWRDDAHMAVWKNSTALKQQPKSVLITDDEEKI